LTPTFASQSSAKNRRRSLITSHASKQERSQSQRSALPNYRVV